ncbi:MAG: transcriptional regulator, IclR family [Sphingomonadales bacterium]|nr:transcriptional regulator, IclR family [Sphingomonadales bacterium]
MDSTTQKGFRILEKLAQSDTPRGISDLARETDLTKSNIQRIIATLCDLGYAEKDIHSNRYFATMRMWEIGLPVLMRNRILRAARSSLKALRVACDETIILCIRDGFELVYIERMESVTPIRLSGAVGTRLPMYSTAAGRAMAGFLEPDEQRELIALSETATERLVFDLRKRLSEVHEQGYEMSEGYFRPGINSIAVPIWDEKGQVAGALAISGPAERLPEERLKAFLPTIMDSASKVSAGLGYAGGHA